MLPPVDLSSLTREHFEPLLNQHFAVAWPDLDEALQLTKVLARKRRGPATRDPFTLIFKGGDPTIELHPQIHPLEHPAMGRLEVCLEPVSREPDGCFTYQAVFG